jgi:hypothetical protein
LPRGLALHLDGTALMTKLIVDGTERRIDWRTSVVPVCAVEE